MAKRPDTEHNQVLLRILAGILGVVYVVMINWYYPPNDAVGFMGQILGPVSIIIVGIVLFVHIVMFPQRNPLRRYLGMTADMLIIGYTLFAVGDRGIVVFGMYVWVVIGNGFRYGIKYLYHAALLALFTFYVSIYFSEAYHGDVGFIGLGTFLLGVVIPIYIGTLLKNLQKGLEAAREADRLKTRFLSNVSHDLRTPLNAIQANAELLSCGLSADARQARQLRDIRDAGATLNRLVTDLLDVARMEAGRLVISHDWFDLPALLGRVVRFNRPAAESAGTRVLLSVDEAVPIRVRGDAMRLEQVLNNLVSNAVKYTGGGEVWIHVGEADRDDATCLARLVFEVRDTGIGMPADAVGRIFQRFEQVDAASARQRSGAGLGLSIVRELVDLMGGAIEVESTPGEGSCFAVSLPLEADTAFMPDLAAGPALPRLAVICADEAGRTYWNSLFDGARLPRAGVWLPGEARDHLSVAGGWRRDPLCVIVDGGGLGARADEPHALLSLDAAWPAEAEVAWILANAPEAVGGRGYRVRLAGAAEDAIRRAIAMAVGTLGSGDDLAADGAAGPAAGLRGVSVLIADDNPLNRRVLTDMLGHAHARVVEARDGGGALERLLEGGVDVALLDIRMPDMTGTEVMRAYAERRAGDRVPLIALTADVTEACRTECLSAGAASVLHKPVDMGSLYRALGDVLGLHDEGRAGAPSPGAASGDGELLDYRVLRELSQMGWQADYVPSLVRCFEQDGSELVEAVREATGRRDIPASRMLLHRMKGMSSTIGARALAGFCHELLSMPDEHLRRFVPHVAGVLGRLHQDTLVCLDRFTVARP